MGIIIYWTLGIFQKMVKRREDNAGQTAAIAVKPIVAQATTELNIAISQGTNETVKVWWDTFSIPLGDFLGSPRNEQTSYILFTLAKIFKHLETKTESSNLIASACRSRGLLP